MSVRLGPIGATMHSPTLWVLSLRRPTTMWVMRAQASLRCNDLLLGFWVCRDEDDELLAEMGFWPFRWTLHQCELVPSDMTIDPNVGTQPKKEKG